MYKVLIADDEPYVIEGLDIMIDWGKYGFEIAERAYSGTEAWEKLSSAMPDLIVTDINMLGISGLELIDRIVSSGYDGEIIVLTGYAEVDYARRAMTYGVKYLINKPVDTDEFHEALADAKLALDGKRKLTPDIDRSEGLAAAQRRNIVAQKISDKTVYGVMVLYIGDEDIREDILPENIYVYERYAVTVSLLICEEGDFNEITERVFEILRGAKPKIIGMRRPLGDESLKECIDNTIKSMRNCMHYDRGKLYDTREPGTKKISPIEIADCVDKVMAQIELCDNKGAKEEIDRYFGLLEESADPLAYAMIFTSYLLVRTNKLLLTKGGKPCSTGSELKNVGSLGLYNYYGTVKSICRMAIAKMKEHRMEADGDVFDMVEKYIKEHFREQIVIQDIAKRMYTSPGYLGTVFTKKMGISIKEYLHTMRMEEAVRLMTQTDMSLSEIAYNVGYNNYNNFYHHFERFFGMTPREYKDAM